MAYDIPVLDEKVKPHQVTTLHMICALAFIVAGVITLRYSYTIAAWGAVMLGIGILITILVMARNKWVISKQVNPLMRIFELFIAISIEVYSIVFQYKFPTVIFGILIAALLFGLLWERTAGDQLSVHLDEEGIKFPTSSGNRNKPWKEVEEVIHRFGILTINCTDNSLLQWNTNSPAIDNKSFESWCSTMVEEGKTKRRNDDW